jgi:NAD(P)-dependent dehydrogenase (short-subunit alcohol dehydrogenase family)
LEVTVTSRQDPGEPSVEDLTEPRVAVVTGASSGIGLAAAEELARRGWSIALVGRDNRLCSFFLRYAPGLRTPAEEAQTLVWLATANAAALRSGAYYVDERERRPAAKATEPALAGALWEASRQAVKV